jgi:hypothetical protein
VGPPITLPPIDRANDSRDKQEASAFRAAPLIVIVLLPLLVGCAHDSRQADGTTSTSRAVAAASSTPRGAGNVATRLVMWAACDDVVALSDKQLDAWKGRGIGGFVCGVQYLANLGGSQDFSGDPKATLAGSRYDLQRRIRDSRVVQRASQRGIKLWLSVHLSDYFNHATPLLDWFDDSGWSNRLLPKLADLAGAAHALGFEGLAFDEEPYYGATWDWTYPGNTHSQAAVRAEVRRRGAQMMRTIVQAFPGVDLLDYGTYFTDGWNALVQHAINHTQHPYARSVQINLWDGLTSVAGYGPIRFMDATFYKTWHLSNASWDTAMTYNVNRLMAYLSRNLANWSYASSRISISPFAWIDGDVAHEGSFTAPRDPAYVAAQLAAFQRWGMGGAFSIFSYEALGKFDYAPYARGMRAAATPATVDDQSPALSIDTVTRSRGDVVVTGTAIDNTAIRDIGWRTDATSGTAPMTWTVTGGDYTTAYQWRMDWTATIPAPPGPTVTITARDIWSNAASMALAAP